MMHRRSFLGGVALSLLAEPYAARGQQPAKLLRIGYLTAASAAANAGRIEALRQGLRELGYIEGTNIAIEYRYAEGKLDRLPELASELIRLEVAVIVSAGPAVTRTVKRATAAIPIVMAFDSDPVGNGFVAGLAHPGGNVTGLSALSPESSAKQLELLKEIVPRLFRVTVFGNSTEPANAPSLKEIARAAGILGVQVQRLDVLQIKDVPAAFRAAIEGHSDAVLVLTSAVTSTERTPLVTQAAKSRLPAMYWAPEFVDDGGLMFYGVSLADLYRRAATYVDRILKGTRPADLPVEQPTKFDLAINLRTAKALGLVIPPSVLLRADEVIK
jgi:putative tryptophan/tyrosine transport system substrate-binding protein